MAETTTQDGAETTEDAPRNRADKAAERKATRLARQIRAFARAHGGSVDGHMAHLGRERVRVVLVAADGAWGDLVTTGPPVAERAMALAEITVHPDFDTALAAKIRTGEYEWQRMAGSQLGGGSPPGQPRP